MLCACDLELRDEKTNQERTGGPVPPYSAGSEAGGMPLRTAGPHLA